MCETMVAWKTCQPCCTRCMYVLLVLFCNRTWSKLLFGHSRGGNALKTVFFIWTSLAFFSSDQLVSGFNLHEQTTKLLINYNVSNVVFNVFYVGDLIQNISNSIVSQTWPSLHMWLLTKAISSLCKPWSSKESSTSTKGTTKCRRPLTKRLARATLKFCSGLSRWAPTVRNCVS